MEDGKYNKYKIKDINSIELIYNELIEKGYTVNTITYLIENDIKEQAYYEDYTSK